MPLLIDVYNVLHTTGVLPPDLAGLDVAGLRELIATSRYRHTPATLVCDGLGPGRSQADGASVAVYGSTIEVLYAGTLRDADGLIEQAIWTHSAPRQLLVVSSDKRVRRAARRRDCRALSSEAFLQRLDEDFRSAAWRKEQRFLAPAVAFEVPLDRASVGYWRKYFGFPEAPAPAEPMPAVAPPSMGEAQRVASRSRERKGAGDRNGAPILDPRSLTVAAPSDSSHAFNPAPHPSHANDGADAGESTLDVERLDTGAYVPGVDRRGFERGGEKP